MPTEIAWTDETWNPTTGCDRVSPGCDNCYALTLAKRLKAMGQEKYQRDGDPRTSGPGFGLTVHPDALDLPLRWKKPRRVFVNSMSDLFHPDVPTEFIARVFTTMGRSERHTFQVLTKRPQRMAKVVNRLAWRDCIYPDGLLGPCDLSISTAYFLDGEGEEPLPNVWLGTSVENQRYADLRIPHLLATPAAVRFLSVEPMLGPVELSGWLFDGAPRIDWVIVGGESGPGARLMREEWVEQIIHDCRAANVAVFVKQLGTVLGGKRHADIETFPVGLQIREWPPEQSED